MHRNEWLEWIRKKQHLNKKSIRRYAIIYDLVLFSLFGRVRYDSLFFMCVINWPRIETKGIRIKFNNWCSFQTNNQKKEPKNPDSIQTFVNTTIGLMLLILYFACNVALNNYLFHLVDFNFHIIFQSFIKNAENALKSLSYSFDGHDSAEFWFNIFGVCFEPSTFHDRSKNTIAQEEKMHKKAIKFNPLKWLICIAIHCMGVRRFLQDSCSMRACFAIDEFRNWSKILTNLWLTLGRSLLIKLHTTAMHTPLFIQLVAFVLTPDQVTIQMETKDWHMLLFTATNQDTYIRRILWSDFDLTLWILIENFIPIYRGNAPVYSMWLFFEVLSKRLKCHTVWQVHISRHKFIYQLQHLIPIQSSHELDLFFPYWFD